MKCVPGDPTITCPVLFKGSRSPPSLAQPYIPYCALRPYLVRRYPVFCWPCCVMPAGTALYIHPLVYAGLSSFTISGLYICLTSLTRAKWNFPLNFCTMHKLSDLYSGIFQNSLTCAKWNFPLNFRTMRKLSDLYSGIFQTQSSGCASGVDLFRNFTKLKILNI